MKDCILGLSTTELLRANQAVIDIKQACHLTLKLKQVSARILRIASLYQLRQRFATTSIVKIKKNKEYLVNAY